MDILPFLLQLEGPGDVHMFFVSTVVNSRDLDFLGTLC